MKNPYDTLGVGKNATTDDIKKAYRKKAKRVHPDAGGKSEDMREANNAYAVLVNPVRRQRFDETGETEDPQKTIDATVAELQGLFVSAVEALDHRRVNIIVEVRACIQDSLTKFNEVKKGHEKRADKFRDAVTRVTTKRPDNPIAQALQNQVEQAAAMIAQCDKRIECAHSMLTMLDLFEWRTDPMDDIYSWLSTPTQIPGFRTTKVR